MLIYFDNFLRGGGVALLVAFSTSCAVERIDEIIAEHGVTYPPSSTGSEAGSTDSSSTSTGTGTTEISGSVGTHQSSTSPCRMIGSESSTSDTDGGSSSTGDPGAVCGNGIVEGEETCDDANEALDDGCQYCANL